MSEGKCAIIGAKCPKNNLPERGGYCPHWALLQETNDVTGAERVTEGCSIPAMQRWMADVQKAGWAATQFISMVANGERRKQLNGGAPLVGIEDTGDGKPSKLFIED